MADELTRVDQWLYETLSGDAALGSAVGTRVYADVAPQGAAFPYLVFSYQGGSDKRGVGTARYFVEALYLVKAVRQGESYQPLQTVMDRVDALLQGSSGGTATGGTVYASVREQSVRFPEVTEGRQYRHLGGVYRITVQSTAQ